MDRCKEKSAEKMMKKKRKHLDNSIEDSINLRGWKDVYERETKTLDCLFDNLREEEKYRTMNKDEFRKEKNNLTASLMQEKTVSSDEFCFSLPSLQYKPVGIVCPRIAVIEFGKSAVSDRSRSDRRENFRRRFTARSAESHYPNINS